MSYFGVSLRNGVGLGLGTVPSLTNTPLGYRLAPSLNLSFAGSDTLDPRITFSRTTNATLTNSAGLVANAPMNLLTFSEQFDNAAWTKTNATITANAAVAPNGTTTADTITDNATSGFHRVQQNTAFVVGNVYTISVYAKQGTTGIALLLNDSAANFARASFDLVTGIATLTTGTAADISPVGDGWFRCSVTATATATGSGQSSVHVKSVFTYVGTGEFAYIWGAQLELGSTATTYNSTTVKNLLGFTEHFDNAAWTKSNASISATKVDDIYGQPFAQQVTSSASNGTVLSTYTAVASTPYTFSIWMKRVTGTGNIDISADGTTWATQTLTTEWQRFSVTVSPTAGSKTPGVRIATSGDSIYIFGAQLSDSASVDPYVYQPVAAPSSVAYYGPRFDYDPVTLAPKGLLIEEQRTNLLTYSEQLENAAWAVSGATVSANGAVAPDGTTTADKLVEDTATGVHTIAAPAFNSTISTAYTFSFYAKAAERNIAVVFDGAFSGNEMASFNLSTGVATILTVFGSNSASMVPVGNGWYRCIYTETANATLTGTRGFNRIRLSNGTTTSYTGDGTSGIFLWGAQLEAGAFATSYIPTVASQVTRAADSASMIGNNFARWYTQGVGTIFADWLASAPQLGNYRVVTELSDGTTNNRIRFSDDDTFRARLEIRAGGDTSMATSVVTTSARKQAGGWSSSGGAICANGGAVAEDLTVVVPTSITSMLIGSAGPVNSTINSTISRIAYYNRRLSNTELQGITS